MSTYIIDTNGLDTNTGLSESEPWKTIAKVNSFSFTPGDMIRFKQGQTFVAPTYQGLIINSSGMDGNPITINTYGTGNPAILSNPGTTNYSRIISINADWIVVDGLKLDNAHETAVQINGTHNIVKRCEISNVGNGVQVLKSHNTIEDNFIHNLHWVNQTGGNGGAGIVVNGSYVNITKNTFFRTLQEAIALYGGMVDGCFIEQNTAVQCDCFVEVGLGSFCHDRITKNIIIDPANVLVLHLGGTYASSICSMEFDENDVIQTVAGWTSFAFIGGIPNQFTLHSHHNTFHVKDHSFVSNQPGFTEDHNYYHLENTVLGFTAGDGSVIWQG